MERREFLTITAFGAAGAVASSVFSQGVPTTNATSVPQTQTHDTLKISVLKRTMQDGKNVQSCNRNRDGQKFVVASPGRKPDGFCDIAWEDIRPYVEQVGSGTRETTVCSCTGTIHVVFKIERMNN
jgi:uncharacterized repeat protein (TIGR04076 family)